MIQFSSRVRTQLYQSLKTSFPDAKVSDADITALAVCVYHHDATKDGPLPASLSGLDLSPYGAELEQEAEALPALQEQSSTRKAGDQGRYYWVTASHQRHSPSGFSPFQGTLGMVRVSLHATEPQTYRTAFGTVDAADHLIDTVFEANQKYKNAVGYEVERVDLITPARDMLRFGAISVLLCYKKATDKVPSYYILEAGTATGQPKVLYLGKAPGAPINSYAGYRPTPFACPSHAYLGTLTLKNGDDPDLLSISSRVVRDGKSERPYINVDIRWELQTGSLKNVWPGFILARATAIVVSRSLEGKISADCVEQTPGSK